MKTLDHMRLYDLAGCRVCLEPNLKPNEQVCFRCKDGRSFERLLSLGIYVTYPSYQELFGRHRFHYIGHQIRYMKPYKSGRIRLCSIQEKERIGEITARLLAWLIREKGVDLTEYKTIIPVPSYYEENQVNYFGVPLSSLLNINYEPNSLIRTSPMKKTYKVSTSPAGLKNQSVILLDDVYKRGETKDKCSNLLKTLGVTKILVVVLGRTVNKEWWGDDDFG